MGNLIDAHSIVISTAVTRQTGQERQILRFVLWQSVALALLLGGLVFVEATVFPWIVPKA